MRRICTTVHYGMMEHLFIGLMSNMKVILFSLCNDATDWWSVFMSMGEKNEGEGG